MFKYGVNARSEQFDTAMRAGAAYVEPVVVGNLIVKDEAGAWIRNPGYRGAADAPSFAVLFPGELRLSDPEFSREAVGAYIEVAMGIIASVAAKGAKVVFGSGAARTIPAGLDRGAAESTFAEVLRQARDGATRHGLQIILEPLQQGETNLLHTIGECAQFLDKFAIDVPVVADLYHIMLENEPLQALREFAPLIGHAHVADSGRVPPGQGNWPIAEFVRTLEEIGYSGSVSIECKWTNFAEELGPSLQFMRSLK